MARILVENFEGSGYENTDWTATVSTGSSLDPDVAVPGVGVPPTPGAPPVNSGSQCLKSVVTSGVGANAYISKSITPQQHVYYRQYVRFEEIGLTNDQVLRLFRIMSATDTLIDVGVINVAGSNFWWYDVNTGVGNYHFTDSVAGSGLNLWYRIEIEYSIPERMYMFKINGSIRQAGDLGNVSAFVADSVRVGLTGANASSGQTIVYTDLVALDNFTWIGDGTTPEDMLTMIKLDSSTGMIVSPEADKGRTVLIL